MFKAIKLESLWPAWAKQAFRRLAVLALPAGLILAVGITAAASWTRAFEIYELQAYDWRCRLSVSPTPSSPVYLIDIWDDALTSIGRWPFDRQFHAVLLDVLRTHQAKAAAFDVLFVEPSPTDSEFVASTQKYGKVYFCEAMKYPEVVRGRVEAPGILAPLLPDLKAAAAGVAHVNITVDPDGKRRRLAPVIWENGKPRFQLGLLLAMNYLGVKPSQVTFESGAIYLGDKLRIPIDENGETLVRFHGKWGTPFTHMSYLEVLTSYHQELSGEKPHLDLSTLKDKVCIVGLTATGTHDINATPIDPLYPQVGLHADFFQNVIDRDFMSRFPRWVNLIAAILLGWGGWMVSRIKRLPLGVAAALGFWAGFIALNLALFVWARQWLDLFFPSVLWWGVYLSAIVWRTMQEKRKRELLETELSIASKIQRSFLPAVLPSIDGYEMDVFMRPAKHVGGDLYAALKLGERYLGIMCGDVSGKGMPAALFMARSVAEFKFHSASGSDPAETLRRLNNGLADVESSGLFVTMNYAVVDLQEKKLVLSNGGHMPVVRIQSSGETSLLTPDGGMPIGLVGDVDFGRLEVSLEPGDVFLMYSDGISEARNRKAQDFEIERVMDAAKRFRLEPASAICAQIVQAVDLFAAGAPQHDDMTLFVFKVRG